MDPILAVVISGIISILVAYLTAQQKTKMELGKERAKADIQINIQQKHDYFHPFKHNADEFRGRLNHIRRRLIHEPETSEKRKNMITRMSHDFETRNLEWFYSDSVDELGGYYITSTVYLNCIFFYWLKRIQHEQPFMTLDVSKVGDKERIAYQELAKEHKYVRRLTGDTFDIYDLTRSMRVSIALEHGIPFSLHDSLGDFMFNQEQKRLANYNDFCLQLLDESERTKFKPALNFWTNIVDKNGGVDQSRLNKIEDLHIILNVLKFSQLR